VNLADWTDRYRRAWEEADADLVLTLFTEDASYRANPFEEPHLGHAGIRAYWEGVTGQQRDARVRMGRPFVDGDRVTVEWWTTMVSEGQEVTLPGCLLLRFEADGRCSDLREYWNVAGGRLEPFAGWGS
jgi:ketosteroid isomerase-like protein